MLQLILDKYRHICISDFLNIVRRMARNKDFIPIFFFFYLSNVGMFSLS